MVSINGVNETFSTDGMANTNPQPPNPKPKALQGYLADKKPPPPVGQPYGFRHRPTAGPCRGDACPFSRGSLIQVYLAHKKSHLPTTLPEVYA